MKILYFTDTHIRGNSPRSRKDDFPSTIRRKMEEIIELANIHQVDYVLHGGDVFDHPNLSPAVVGDFASLFRGFGVPVYAIAGNHDVYAHNPITLPRTMLGLLDAFGTLQLVHEGNRIKLEKDGIVVQLSGQPFHYDLDKREISFDYAVKNEMEAHFCIHMVHSMLVDRPLPDSVAHTLISQLWELDSDVDVVLTGHYHAGFPVQHREGRYVLNPGAIARVNNHLSEMRRTPQVVLLTLTDCIDVTVIPLTSAQLGEEILDRSHIEKARYQEERWAEFTRQVDAALELKTLNVDTIIETIADNDEIQESVRLDALRRISKAKEMREGEGA
ncbi:DNA repair exonuclease SbcCD nuclease subunit [Thermoactinomyces sp. DSM 45891]|uniref:metallophosphoesterase family protein n=1 Tax=Thermoactinomyces sp. DSM 45891 TaxID=1761907 RepID=UPI00091B87E2|nr:metallophosphoesterase [Thermoactinomyces sp. DSM 45891]SFX34176.1 DNA repair exonuclease SbcCD nuclease subunit [Thermoactinomyces sp. DSM 45891]